ncbi:MAG: UDP-N-acetylmuramoylalanine--D-glutamate ligase [Acidobacteria bacterium RIFCSPLOWO2_12_FULL_54_10]|nr:MAG: UDP-N-acetylmuramoylalanine--D-glutamate ligase [Acidobacteria bacterium RIFCSPLOWO2_12_FULL_54_10]
MQFSSLKDRSVLLLGLGREGLSTYRWLRARFPEKVIGLADRLSLEQIGGEFAESVAADGRARLHLGADYLKSLQEYELVVKSPGISVTVPELKEAAEAGKRITSHTAIFFANCPGRIVGITGTKGKSTTASLIYAVLQEKFEKTHLVGNIGRPALDALAEADAETVFVYELSSHQLVELRQSPQVAVLLNIVPEHLDYYASFEQYADAKENITRFQTESDVLVYDADGEIPLAMAARSRARKAGISIEAAQRPGSYVDGEWIVWCSEAGESEKVIAAADVPLAGRFNLLNVAAVVAVGKVMGVESAKIAAAVRRFKPLEHRLELVGTYGGVTYYNDAIATVPEAAIGALDALGERVETMLLGGTDRGLNFLTLAKRLTVSKVKTLILFPPTGERIWESVRAVDAAAEQRFRHFFVRTMEEAVALAKEHTARGKICLHSPASPSFGLFRDYRERGERFKELVRKK